MGGDGQRSRPRRRVRALAGLAAVLAGLGLVPACSGGSGDSGTPGAARAAATGRPTSASPAPATAPASRVPPRATSAAAARWRAGEPALEAALRMLAAGRPEFSVAVRDNRTGEVFAHRGTTRFETASVVKVDVLAALLLRAQGEKRSLTATERALARRMITVSDNAATSALYRRIGRGAGLTRANARLGLTRTVPSPSSWGLTRTTTLDQVALMSEFRDSRGPLWSGNRAYGTTLMRSVVAGQRWGVSAPARPGEKVALKNGWLPRSTEGRRWIVNSVGRVTGPDVDVSIAVLSHGSRTQAAGIATVEEVARLTRVHLRW